MSAQDIGNIGHENIRSAFSNLKTPGESSSAATKTTLNQFKQSRDISRLITSQINASMTGVGNKVDTLA
jgi:hypothetical protein